MAFTSLSGASMVAEYRSCLFSAGLRGAKTSKRRLWSLGLPAPFARRFCLLRPVAELGRPSQDHWSTSVPACLLPSSGHWWHPCHRPAFSARPPCLAIASRITSSRGRSFGRGICSRSYGRGRPEESGRVLPHWFPRVADVCRTTTRLGSFRNSLRLVASRLRPVVPTTSTWYAKKKAPPHLRAAGPREKGHCLSYGTNALSQLV